MPWVEFVEPFMWRPIPKITIAYKKGMRLFVTRACAAESIRKGKAVPSTRPQKVDDASR